jgi:hypothetical protein
LSANAHTQTHACLLEDEELLEELDDEDEDDDDDDDDDDEEDEDDDDDESESEASACVCWGGGGGKRCEPVYDLGSSSLSLSHSLTHTLSLSPTHKNTHSIRAKLGVSLHHHLRYRFRV